MRFNRHSGIEGSHAFLSPSSYAWIRYDEDKLFERFNTSEAARLGVRKHNLASELIKLKQKLPATKQTLNAFVNDVIGARMASEQVLFYSENCFGTADAIGFNDKTRILRIYDLKTGVSKASVDQLLVYGALFCLEYNVNPFEIEYDLRIYQTDEIQVFEVDPVDVANIKAKIIEFDKLLNKYKREQFM